MSVQTTAQRSPDPAPAFRVVRALLGLALFVLPEVVLSTLLGLAGVVWGMVFDVQLLSEGIPASRIPLGAVLVLIIVVLAPATLALSGALAGVVVGLCGSVIYALVRRRWSRGYTVKSAVLAGAVCGVGFGLVVTPGAIWLVTLVLGLIGMVAGLVLGVLSTQLLGRRRPPSA